MYCVNCGVQLADTEKSCPLCGTVCYHPEISRTEAAPLYPNHRNPRLKVNSGAIHNLRHGIIIRGKHGNLLTSLFHFNQTMCCNLTVIT